MSWVAVVRCLLGSVLNETKISPSPPSRTIHPPRPLPPRRRSIPTTYPGPSMSDGPAPCAGRTGQGGGSKSANLRWSPVRRAAICARFPAVRSAGARDRGRSRLSMDALLSVLSAYGSTCKRTSGSGEVNGYLKSCISHDFKYRIALDPSAERAKRVEWEVASNQAMPAGDPSEVCRCSESQRGRAWRWSVMCEE